MDPRLICLLLLLTLYVQGRLSRSRKRTRTRTHHKHTHSICSSSPCKNGGECIDLTTDSGVRKFECSCLEGFQGLTCQKRINPCAKEPCLNGGQCTPRGGENYHCICTGRFQGKNCGQEKKKPHDDPCESKPCSPNGACIPANDDYICECSTGYHGPRCLQKTKEHSGVVVAVTSDENKGLRGTVIALIVLFVLLVIIAFLMLIHCCRIYNRRSALRAAQQHRIAIGEDPGLEVPGWIDTSNILCNDFFCCRERQFKHVYEVTGVIVPVEEFKSMMCPKHEFNDPIDPCVTSVTFGDHPQGLIDLPNGKSAHTSEKHMKISPVHNDMMIRQSWHADDRRQSRRLSPGPSDHAYRTSLQDVRNSVTMSNTPVPISPTSQKSQQLDLTNSRKLSAESIEATQSPPYDDYDTGFDRSHPESREQNTHRSSDSRNRDRKQRTSSHPGFGCPKQSNFRKVIGNRVCSRPLPPPNREDSQICRGRNIPEFNENANSGGEEWVEDRMSLYDSSHRYKNVSHNKSSRKKPVSLKTDKHRNMGILGRRNDSYREETPKKKRVRSKGMRAPSPIHGVGDTSDEEERDGSSDERVVKGSVNDRVRYYHVNNEEEEQEDDEEEDEKEDSDDVDEGNGDEEDDFGEEHYHSRGFDDGYVSTSRLSESDAGGRARDPQSLHLRHSRHRRVVNEEMKPITRLIPKQEPKGSRGLSGTRESKPRNCGKLITVVRNGQLARTSFPAGGDSTEEEEEDSGPRVYHVNQRHTQHRPENETRRYHVKRQTTPSQNDQTVQSRSLNENGSTGVDRRQMKRREITVLHNRPNAHGPGLGENDSNNRVASNVGRKRLIKRGEIVAASRMRLQPPSQDTILQQRQAPSPKPKGILKRGSSNRSCSNNNNATSASDWMRLGKKFNEYTPHHDSLRDNSIDHQSPCDNMSHIYLANSDRNIPNAGRRGEKLPRARLPGPDVDYPQCKYMALI